MGVSFEHDTPESLAAELRTNLHRVLNLGASAASSSSGATAGPTVAELRAATLITTVGRFEGGSKRTLAQLGVEPESYVTFAH